MGSEMCIRDRSERKKMGDFEVRVNSDGNNNNNIYNDNGENSVLNDNIGRLRISN